MDMADSTTEKTRVEVVEGPNGVAEIFETFESNQALQYSVVFKGETESFMSLGEAYIEAGNKAGKRT
jgi:hypothetical protein